MAKPIAAAKEIKGLIQTSSSQLNGGSKLVGETGDALARIVARVNEISKLVADIAVGAEQQATGIGQINTAIQQMDQGTQQNAAMVEESTAAVHALSRETDAMADLMARFALGDSQTDPIRAELKETAPHMFSPAQKTKKIVAGPPRIAGSNGFRSIKDRPQRPLHAASNGWEEF